MSTTSINLPRRAPRLKWPILIASPLALVVGYTLMPEYVEARDEIGYGLRVTARVAFVFLLCAYLGRPLLRLFGVGRLLVANRRYLGLSMAFAHTVHFGYVAAWIAVIDEPVGWITYVFGGLAFVLMWLMAATSNQPSMDRLGRRWKQLHTCGIHYLWLIFMQSFVGRIGPEDEYYLYAGLSLAGSVALLARVWAYRSQRLSRTT